MSTLSENALRPASPPAVGHAVDALDHAVDRLGQPLLELAQQVAVDVFGRDLLAVEQELCAEQRDLLVPSSAIRLASAAFPVVRVRLETRSRDLVRPLLPALLEEPRA